MIEMGFVVCHEKVGEPAALGRAESEMTMVRQDTNRTDTAWGTGAAPPAAAGATVG